VSDATNTIDRSKPLLAVENLGVTFRSSGRETRAVDGISFDVAAGEILGIVGESGSGKSVSSLAVLRLVRPPGRIVSGKVNFDGRDLLTLPQSAMHGVRGSQISMISQDPITSLNPVMTIGDQLIRVVRLHVERDPRRARELAIEALKQVEMPSPERRLEQYPHELSGGMSQRVLIAMAIVSEPRLLIADEPTTALDVTIQSQILDLLMRVRDEHGISIMFISHDLAVVSEISDRIMVMYAGQAMEKGPVMDVLHRPQHPYTQALLRALPHLEGGGLRERISVIPGQVATLGEQTQGCVFAPRCRDAMERCFTQQPPTFQTGGSRSAACWLHEGSVVADAGGARPSTSEGRA
jgi:oligopeptide/dipeptide ABC transporter ATP-binding protein